MINHRPGPEHESTKRYRLSPIKSIGTGLPVFQAWPPRRPGALPAATDGRPIPGSL
jgi:hypothetical protein